jgi:hypothetical protein
MLFCGMSIGFEDTTGTRFWMSTRRFGRRKSIPDVAAPGADRPRRGHGLRAVSSALWAWLDPETVASRIIDHLDARADHVLVSAFRDLDSAVDQLDQLAPHSPTRSRAEPHPKAVALRCYRCSANVFSTGDVRRRVNGATHTTRMTNPIRTSTPTTPTMATNSGCIWTDDRRVVRPTVLDESCCTTAMIPGAPPTV